MSTLRLFSWRLKRSVFLWEVRERENTRSRRYWLEIVNGAGEICKLPCRTEIAARWLP